MTSPGGIAGAAAVAEVAGAGGASPRQARRGPAPFASFDHDVSDEVRPDSSPESKLTFQLPEIREDGSSTSEVALSVPEARARSHSSPAVHAGAAGAAGVAALPGGTGLKAPGAPRIDISRASSSSHQDSRDSSPDMAFPSELAFREEGALDLRSSTEELAFLECTTTTAPTTAATSTVPAITTPTSRRHSRKDSQSSELALLGVCGRSSRLSSVGSQGSALSAFSRISATSRSPSPHRMLVETSFCGPRPIDDEPEACERRLLEIARLSTERRESAPAAVTRTTTTTAPTPATVVTAHMPPSTSSTNNKVRTETTFEQRPQSASLICDEKVMKESKNRAKVEKSCSMPRQSRPQNGNIIRIRLKPDDEYDDDDVDDSAPATTTVAASSHNFIKPVTLELRAETASPPTRTPSPNAGTPQRKASFCSLFRPSPESPASASGRRKKSLGDSRPRSASRDRTAGLRGSVLSLFRTPRRPAPSPPPPHAATVPCPPPVTTAPSAPSGHLKYYEETRDGIIHIPLRTPPEGESVSADSPARSTGHPLTRTVLPDGSIIIPLHSPTEKNLDHDAIEVSNSPVLSERAPKPSTRVSSPSPPRRLERVESPLECRMETRVQATIENVGPKEVSKTEGRKQHVVFSTQVGGGQVFSTQLSVTKTPSITSELSLDSVAPPPPIERPTTKSSPIVAPEISTMACSPEAGPSRSAESRADSSESEASSEAASARRDGEEGERRGLVIGQESFEDELPYVPTTLPMERSLALPMVPVRERARVHVAPVQRPRPPAIATSTVPPPVSPAPLSPRPGSAPAEKILISLPKSGRVARGGNARGKTPPPARTDWIDFEEVPERRKQPKRIQTLPRGEEGLGAAVEEGGVVYVTPEHCRCECHHRSSRTHSRHSSVGAECEGGAECSREGDGSSEALAAAVAVAAVATSVELRVHIARPFTGDLDLREHTAVSPEEQH